MRIIAAALALTCMVPAWAVQEGDTREAVLAELGKPQKMMTAGPREILIYANGRVEITEGKVSGIKGTPAKLTEPPPAPVPEPAASPAAPTAAVAPAPKAAPVAPPQRTAKWHTNIAEAQAAAAKENKLILALFTGTDWCPPCQAFEAEVAHDPQFAGIFSGSFVFFKNDWLRNTPQPEAEKDEVRRLKIKYFVAVYPTLLVLNAEGEKLAKVEWTEVQAGSFKEAMIEAIDNARKATKGGKKVTSWWWPF